MNNLQKEQYKNLIKCRLNVRMHGLINNTMLYTSNVLFSLLFNLFVEI